MAFWKVHVRDSNLVNLGRLETFERATFRLRLNEAGSFLIEGIRADDPIAAALYPTSTGGGTQGVMLLRNEFDIIASGPVKQTRPTEDAEGFDASPGQLVARLNVAGVDDTALLAERVIQPDIDGPPYAATYYSLSGKAQTVMHTLVSANASTAAAPYGRQIRGLTIGPNSDLGATVAGSWRFENLLAELQKLALPSSLRFHVRQSIDGTRAFLVVGTSDLRGQVIFRVGASGGGVLASIESAETAPTVNYIYRFGRGEDAARQVDESGDTPSIAKWGRIEATIDGRQSNDAAQVATDISAAISKGAGFESFQVSAASDDPLSLQFVDDYNLGDRVSWRTWDGRMGEGYVVEVEVVLDGRGGTIITPTIASTRVAPSSRDSLRAIGQRVGRLEAGIGTSPLGVAELWFGSVGTIPLHYSLTDGTSATPDTRNRFLVGAGGQINPAATGGIAMVSGLVQVALNHVHTIGHGHDITHTHTTNIDHNHGAFTTGAPSNTASIATGAGNAASGDHTHQADPPALGTSNITSSNPSPATTTGNPSSTDSGSALSSTFDVTPPYVGVAVITRTS